MMHGEQGEGLALARQALGAGKGQRQAGEGAGADPISSIDTRLSGVASCRMVAVSIAPVRNVERKPARSSVAPTRVKVRSMGPIRYRPAHWPQPVGAIIERARGSAGFKAAGLRNGT